MSDSKHTKGPWVSDYTGNIWGDADNPKNDGDPPLILQIFKGDFEPEKSGPLDEEQLANRDLVLSAPRIEEEHGKMLGWLKELRKESLPLSIHTKTQTLIAEVEAK